MKRIDILDLTADARELFRECEARGTRTLFERSGRPVAMLVSHDEYMALRETIEIANDPGLFAALAEADEKDTRQRAAAPDGVEEPAGESSTRRLTRLQLGSAAQAALDALEGVERRRILAALARINDDPISGSPLFQPLKGLWSQRVEDLRIVYKIVAEAKTIVILSIARGSSGSE